LANAGGGNVGKRKGHGSNRVSTVGENCRVCREEGSKRRGRSSRCTRCLAVVANGNNAQCHRNALDGHCARSDGWSGSKPHKRYVRTCSNARLVAAIAARGAADGILEAAHC
jgi:hypothetical protein